MLNKRKTNFFFSQKEVQERLTQYSQTGFCYPVDVVLHPTTRCNHQCGFCYNTFNLGEEHYDIDMEDVLNYLKEFETLGVQNLIISGGGEPIIHKDIRKLIKESIASPINIFLYTNLDYEMDEDLEEMFERLQGINVNINTTNNEQYKTSRGKGTNPERVKANARRLNEINDHIGATVIVRDDTIGGLESSLRDLINIGFSRIIVSPAFNLPYKDAKATKSCIEDLLRLRRIFSEKEIRILEPEEDVIVDEQGDIYCKIHNFDVTIGADYGLYPCCNVAYDERYKILNLKEFNSFSEAWHSKERTREKSFYCKKCWFAPANKVIMEATK